MSADARSPAGPQGADGRGAGTNEPTGDDDGRIEGGWALKPADIARRRLGAQHLTGPLLRSPAEVVATLGAVQAQDYPGAKWTVGQRMKGATDAVVEQAMLDGAILRTHVLRPTWHFVTPADIRWMLALTAPRVHRAIGTAYRQMELDATVFERSHKALEGALRDHTYRTRAELGEVLSRAGVPAGDPRRLGFLMLEAELEGVICSGPRRGKQVTYALLDERAPTGPVWERDESLAELTRRYFRTRGPATLHDFSWWSGLTIADARRGVEVVAGDLEHHRLDGGSYWLGGSELRAADGSPGAVRASPRAHLLPTYDELFIGLKDRSAIIPSGDADLPPARGGGVLFGNVIIIDGQLVGGWVRSLLADRVTVRVTPSMRLGQRRRAAVAAAARRFARFLELELDLVWSDG